MRLARAARVGWVGLALLALSGGCAARRAAALDASLPDDPVVAVPAPSDVLEAGAADEDPVVRAIALGALVLRTDGDARVRWLVQGSYDADPYVQRAVARAALKRSSDPTVLGLLLEFVGRGSADPYVRLEVGRALGLGTSEAPWPSTLAAAWQRQPPWRAGPLALIAVLAGHDEARGALETALASGEVRDDAAFVTALGEVGDAALASALARGAQRFEEEVSLPFAWARARMGDAEGRVTWRRAAGGADVYAALDAIALVMELPGSDRAAATRGVTPRSAEARAALAAVVGGGEAGPLVRALRGGDAGARTLALEVLARDGLRDPSPRAVEAVRAAVVDALRAEEEGVRVAACGALLAAGWTVTDDVVAPLRQSDSAAERAAAAAITLLQPTP